MTPKHTKVGTGFLTWPPYRDLRRIDKERGTDAAHLWQVLYMSSHAKTGLPGLWSGGYGTMSDTADITADEAKAAVAVLEERGLAEFDAESKVLRLTMLPDKCEAATSPNALRGWWGRYQLVPECAVKRRYLDLLIWLQLPFTASKRSEKVEMREVWDETFQSELNRLNTSPVASAALPAQVSCTQQSQLQLSLTPVNRDMYQHGSRDRSGEGEGKGSAEGESERVVHRPPQLSIVPAPADYQPPEYIGPPVPREPATEPSAAADTSAEAPDVVEAHELWERALGGLRQRMLAQSFAMFIEPISAVALDRRARASPLLHLRAPTEAAANYFRTRHAAQVAAELRAVAGTEIEIAI